MIPSKDLINILRVNSRTRMSYLARKHKLPVNTLYSKFNKLLKEVIKKMVSLPDYNRLGYTRWVIIISNLETMDFNTNHLCINNLYRTNRGCILDCIVSDKEEFTYFLNSLKEKNYEVSLHPVFDLLKVEQAII